MSSKNKEFKVCLRCCNTAGSEILECSVCANQIFDTAWQILDWKIVQMLKYFLPSVEELVKQLPDSNFKLVWLDFLLDKPEMMKHHCCEIENHEPMQELFNITMEYSLSLPPHENVRLLIGVLFAHLLRAGVVCDTELESNYIQGIGLDIEQIDKLKQGLIENRYPVLEPLVSASEDDIVQCVHFIVKDDESKILTEKESAFLCDKYKDSFSCLNEQSLDVEADRLPFRSWRQRAASYKLCPSGMEDNPLPIIQWASLYCFSLGKKEEAKLCLNYCLEFVNAWQSSEDVNDESIIFLFQFIQGLSELDHQLKDVNFSSVSVSLDKLRITLQNKFSQIISGDDQDLNQELLQVLDEHQALIIVFSVLKLVSLKKFSEAEAKLSKVLLQAREWSCENQSEFEDEDEYTRFMYRCRARILSYSAMAYIKAEQNDFNQAIRYAKKANEAAEVLSFEDLIIYPQAAMGYVYFKWGRTSRSEKCFAKAFRILKRESEISTELKLAALPMQLILAAYSKVLNKMGRDREAGELIEVWNKAS